MGDELFGDIHLLAPPKLCAVDDVQDFVGHFRRQRGTCNDLLSIEAGLEVAAHSVAKTRVIEPSP